MEKIVYCSDNELHHTVKYVSSFGDLNNPPTPFVETNESEFIHSFQSYNPLFMEYRQLRAESLGYPKNSVIRVVKILWFPLKAIMLDMPTNWALDDNRQIKYKEPIKYYRIGCEHKFVSVGGRGTYHEEECSKCGVKWNYDSGD